jgi:hypothetical protein
MPSRVVSRHLTNYISRSEFSMEVLSFKGKHHFGKFNLVNPMNSLTTYSGRHPN